MQPWNVFDRNYSSNSKSSVGQGPKDCQIGAKGLLKRILGRRQIIVTIILNPEWARGQKDSMGQGGEGLEGLGGLEDR